VTGAANNGEAHRRAVTIRALHEFRAKLGDEEGIGEVLAYAADPVRQTVDIMLDEIDPPAPPTHATARSKHALEGRAPYLPVGPHVTVGTNWGPHVMRDSERSARLCPVMPRQEPVPGTADQGERVAAIYWGSTGSPVQILSARPKLEQVNTAVSENSSRLFHTTRGMDGNAITASSIPQRAAKPLYGGPVRRRRWCARTRRP
jgi:hypothetical protein